MEYLLFGMRMKCKTFVLCISSFFLLFARVRVDKEYQIGIPRGRSERFHRAHHPNNIVQPEDLQRSLVNIIHKVSSDSCNYRGRSDSNALVLDSGIDRKFGCVIVSSNRGSSGDCSTLYLLAFHRTAVIDGPEATIPGAVP